MLNSCNFIGRLTRTPELRHTQSGTPVASFSLAVDRSRPTKAGDWLADFIDFVAWRGLAEKVCKFEKGDLLTVSGSLEIRPYTTKDGETRYAAEIVADRLRKISSPRNAAATMPSAPQEDPDAFREIPEEPGELPF